MKTLRVSLFLLAAVCSGVSHANVIEKLLARPAIQELLAKQGHIQSILSRCADAKYRQQNANTCKQAEEAKAIAAMPSELRAVMASPPAAASIRELCVAATSTQGLGAGQRSLGDPNQGSYLCRELYKADETFRKMADTKGLQGVNPPGDLSK